MTCDDVRDLLAEHVLGTLDEPPQLAVRRHLRGCASCRQELSAMEEGVSTFARAAHQVAPPEALKERVLAVLGDERADLAASRRPRVRRLALVAASIAVIAGTAAWGAFETTRAAHFGSEASRYEAFLGVLGGKAVRVGQIDPRSAPSLHGNVVMYDSAKGQSWALVLVQAPGLSGRARVVLSSPSSRIEMRGLQFDAGGEASSWLVTGGDISRFNLVRILSTDGRVLGSGRVQRG